MTTTGTRARLAELFNESIFPLALRVARSAATLEYRREWLQQLDADPACAHPAVRCACGSNRVFNYGVPANNGRHFYCRTCERAFTAPVRRREQGERR